MAVTKKTREEIRSERSDAVCREVRYQMAKFGGVLDNQKLFSLVEKWMKVAKEDKYERP